MSWERLQLLAEAHERRAANTMIQLMVAAQGSPDSWNELRDILRKIAK